MPGLLALVLLLATPLFALANVGVIELHQRLTTTDRDAGKAVALTLDACGDGFDRDLIAYLIDRRIPATLFVTRKWLERNPAGIALLKLHPELFEIEDHGANHVPAVIGVGRRVYGIPGAPDLAHLKSEVVGGASAIQQAFGVTPRWYRGATAEYDAEAMRAIEAMGYRIAGFSVNADAGATLPRRVIVARLNAVRDGDVIIAHMNKPASDSAEGLATGLDLLVARGFGFVKLGERNLVRAPG